MKNTNKHGLAFGTGLLVFIIVYGFLQTENFSMPNIIKIIATGIIAGTIGGIAFALIMSKFGNVTKKV